jgi:hypothetical protein
MLDFYLGLKPFIKIEFTIRELEDLEEIIKQVVKIDNHMYEA